MAINVSVGFSRKVGEPNYSSRGASVHLELELDRQALADDKQFQAEVAAIFERARTAVERELEQSGSAHSESADPAASNGNETPNAPQPVGVNGLRSKLRLRRPTKCVRSDHWRNAAKSI